MIAMIPDPQFLLDEIRYPLGSPQLRPIAVRHRSLRQQPHEPHPLRPSQSSRSPRRRFRFEPGCALCSPSVAPSKHAAGVASDPPRNLMQREISPKELGCVTPALLEKLRGTMRSHGAILHHDSTRVLHYLCGSQ